jgi:hypothetical protein
VTEVFEPTLEQRNVIEAPALSKLLVLASAGTGKTETLVHRVDRLLGNDDVQHGNVLVLTFSRAAVRELRQRLASCETEARYVRARTFDSFASRLLNNCPSAGELLGKSYEERICLARKLVSLGDKDALRNLLDFKHLIVDEMQDLVGERQLMVRELILVVAQHGGFTLFSDPAQSIYDWQVRNDTVQTKASEMLIWLRDHFGSELVQRQFSKNFRFETDESQRALWAREELISSDPDFGRVHEKLRRNLRDLKTFTLEQRVPGLKRSAVTTAILARTNAHALVLSRELHKHKIPHTVVRDQADRCLPPWLAVVFRGAESVQLTKTEFIQACAACPADFCPEDQESTWRLLQRRVDRSAGKSINLARISEAFQSGDVPDELCEPLRGTLFVSTVHRAKGLQFSHVMIADPSDNGGVADNSNEDIGEEARILYVAMTRARRTLERLDDPRDCRVGKDKNGRWRLYHFCKGTRFPIVVGFEIIPSDVHGLEPAGGFGYEGDVPEIQRYIQSSVKIGDPVCLRQIQIAAEEGTPRIHYVLQHNDRLIGVTSVDSFYAYRDALRSPKAWGNYQINWPEEIYSVRVEQIDTVAASPATSRKYGLGTSGMWLRVRIAGMGDWPYVPKPTEDDQITLKNG